MKKYFYLKDSELKKGYPCVIEQKEQPITDYENYFLQKGVVVREYYGEASIPERMVWDNTIKKVRKATEQEKYDIDGANYNLMEDKNYIKNDIVKELPPVPQEMLKPVFNIDTELYEETATEVELNNYEMFKVNENYKQQLNKFNLSIAEFNATVITAEEYEISKNYIISLANNLDNPTEYWKIQEPATYSRY